MSPDINGGEMKKFFKKDNGSVSIEATISLTAMMFLFIMIYSLITICRAQAKIAVAVNAVAKELSQYSYLYGLTGLNEVQKKINKDNQDYISGNNSFIADVSNVYNGLQTITIKGKEVTSQPIDLTIDNVINDWDDIVNEFKKAKDSTVSIKNKIEKLIDDPKTFIIGFAKLAGSEAFEAFKTNFIAEPLARKLVQKNLRYSKSSSSSDSESCEKFLKALGIIPGTRYGKTSYINGLDFSDSTLFQYGSDEIVIQVSYKIKMLQLLPINKKLTFTHKAITKGWFNGDKERKTFKNEKQAVIEKLNSLGESIWSTGTAKEIKDLIRSMGVDELKSLGYYGVSNETYTQVYNMEENEFVYITASNPLYNKNSVDDIDINDLKYEIDTLKAIMLASTENRESIDIKKETKEWNAWNTTIETVKCNDRNIKLTVQLVIPEDAGLKEKYEEAMRSVDLSRINIELVTSYGNYFREKEAENRQEDGGNSGQSGEEKGE